MSLMRKQTEIGSAPEIVWVINHLCEVGGGGGGGGIEKWRKLCEAGDSSVKKWGKFYWCGE